jgi:rubrerythrin
MIPDISVQDVMVREQTRDSAWEVQLRTLLNEHGAREQAALVAYHALAGSTGDEGMRYLANMIVDEEARHHRMITEMLRRVDSDLYEIDLEPSVPAGIRPGADFFQATSELLELEKEDEHELRRLRHMMRNEPDGSLLPLLVDLLLLDTQKHITMLRFIEKHA